jgi:release factor glutamine methyltransferase
MNKIDRFEQEVLTAYVLQKNRAYLIAHPELMLTPEQHATLDELINKRAKGVPIAYLIGKREFWSLDFKVTPDVLIPRHETELLVETLLTLLAEKEKVELLELGTGCGAISIAIAKERPCWNITAIDVSKTALDLAQENAVTHQTSNIKFAPSEWFSHLNLQRFHAIVSNPPYIAEDDEHLDQGDLRFEPKLALVSGKDGLSAIKIIASNANSHLYPGGWLCIEHGYDQGNQVREIFQRSSFENITTIKDINGCERVTCAKVAR